MIPSLLAGINVTPVKLLPCFYRLHSHKYSFMVLLGCVVKRQSFHLQNKMMALFFGKKKAFLKPPYRKEIFSYLYIQLTSKHYQNDQSFTLEESNYDHNISESPYLGF